MKAIMKSLREYALSNGICVAAHRGASGIAPENTMAAFREALDSGVDMIEIDVQFTADGKAIVYHDKTLKKAGKSRLRPNELSYEKIKEIDAGSWFDPTYASERIPLLIEVLELIKGKAYLNIEIKASDVDEALLDNLDKLLRVICEYGLEGFVVFASFNHFALKVIKDINPAMNTAAIRIPYSGALPSEIAAAIGCEAFICSVHELNDKISKDAAANNIFIGVYNADTPEALEKALKYKVWAIGTNYPAMVLDEVTKRGLKRSPEF